MPFSEVAMRPSDMGAIRAGLQQPRAKLRAAEVHHDLDFDPFVVRNRSQVGDHPGPDFGSIVRAVDASTVHARFDQLPEQAQQYVRFLEESMECGIFLVSTGPDRNQTILRDDIIN